MDFCTDQNIIVKYPCGAGGKFLISCLFLFDEVAHWSPTLQNHDVDHLQWFQNVWPTDVNQWIKREPQQPWNINFYSRRFERGNQLGCVEYNQLIKKEANDYFFQCWNKGLKIVDHFHKQTVPEFHSSALSIEILINDNCKEKFLKVVKNKLWLWDDLNKTAISTLDHPDYAHNEINRMHRIKFNNNYFITGYDNYNDFFESYVLKQPYIEPFYNVSSNPNCIASLDFLDLIELDRFIASMSVFENYFNKRLSNDLLKQLHQIWATRSQIVS